jgi:hypothetical protein
MTKQEAKLQRRKAKKLARLLSNRNIEYLNSISVRGDGVIALEIAARWNGKTYEAFGGAKCNCTDPWNESIAVEIATGRALLRIAHQILKDEECETIDPPSVVESVIKAFEEFQAMTGIKIFTDKSHFVESPNLDISDEGLVHISTGLDVNPKPIPGSAKYRGDEIQYGWGVIKPEYVPSGLEVMQEKGMLDDKEDEQSASSSGTSEGQ